MEIGQDQKTLIPASPLFLAANAKYFFYEWETGH